MNYKFQIGDRVAVKISGEPIGVGKVVDINDYLIDANYLVKLDSGTKLYCEERHLTLKNT